MLVNVGKCLSVFDMSVSAALVSVGKCQSVAIGRYQYMLANVGKFLQVLDVSVNVAPVSVGRWWYALVRIGTCKSR